MAQSLRVLLEYQWVGDETTLVGETGGRVRVQRGVEVGPSRGAAGRTLLARRDHGGL